MNYADERFADIQLLRYRLNGFEQLSLCQKRLVYYLSQATLYGRDITFDQFGRYNLRIRKMLEAVFCDLTIAHDTPDFQALEVYLKRLWFSNGIYHHIITMVRRSSSQVFQKIIFANACIRSMPPACL